MRLIHLDLDWLEVERRDLQYCSSQTVSGIERHTRFAKSDTALFSRISEGCSAPLILSIDVAASVCSAKNCNLVENRRVVCSASS